MSYLTGFDQNMKIPMCKNKYRKLPNNMNLQFKIHIGQNVHRLFFHLID